MTTAIRFGDVWTFEYYQRQQNWVDSGSIKLLDVDHVLDLLREVTHELSMDIDTSTDGGIAGSCGQERIVS